MQAVLTKNGSGDYEIRLIPDDIDISVEGVLTGGAASPTCAICYRPICEPCSVCHACHPRTQKVRGIRYLSITCLFGVSKIDSRKILDLTCPLVMEQAKVWMDQAPLGLFARPCPMRPRHGFVDSRVVENLDQLVGLIEETRAADPKGEIMLLPFIPSEWNGLWTPGLFTMGGGHDGATAGGADTVRLPLATTYPLSMFANTQIGIADGEVPYVELVMSSQVHHVYVTQVRSGPAVTSTTRDWIPKSVTVTKVIPFDPSASLVEWERILTEAAKEPEGVVVYHPTGSITDHGSVHARQRGIPTVTFEVTPGQVLEATPTSPPPDPLAVLRGIAWSDRMPIGQGDLADIVKMILIGMHHSSAMGGDGGIWVGLAAGMMIRLGSMALRGEARHERSVKRKGARETVYLKHINRSLSYHRAGIGRLVNVFRYGDFGHGMICGSGGTGGMKWAGCAAGLVPIFNAIRELARDQSPEAVSHLILGLNRAVNQAHNNGWWLNKFGGSMTMFNAIPTGDPSWVIGVAPFIWSHLRTPPNEIDVSKYAKWRVVTIQSPSPSSITINVVPSGVILQAKVKGLRSRLNIPVPLESLSSTLNKMISLDWSGGRYRVMPSKLAQKEAKAGGEVGADSEPVAIWEEPLIDEFTLKL